MMLFLALHRTHILSLSLKDPISNHVLAIDVNSGLARVCQTVTVNLGCVMAIEVFISSSLRGAHVLLELSQQLSKLGRAGAKCLVDTLNNEIHYMKVINPTIDPITLSAITCITSATVVNPNTVLSLDNPKPSNTHSDLQPPYGWPIDFDLSDSDLYLTKTGPSSFSQQT